VAAGGASYDDAEDDDLSTVVPYEEMRALSTATMCLVPLSKKSEHGEAVCCPNTVECNTRGHQRKQREGIPRSGEYKVLVAADGARIDRVFLEGFRSTEEAERQEAADEAKMAELSAQRTPQGTRRVQAAVTERTRNAAPPRTIFTPARDRTGGPTAAVSATDQAALKEAMNAGMRSIVQGLPPRLQDVARTELGDMPELWEDKGPKEGSKDTHSTQSLLRQMTETADTGQRVTRVEQLEQELQEARRALAGREASDQSLGAENSGVRKLRTRFSKPPVISVDDSSDEGPRNHYLVLSGLQPVGVYDEKRAAQAKARSIKRGAVKRYGSLHAARAAYDAYMEAWKASKRRQAKGGRSRVYPPESEEEESVEEESSLSSASLPPRKSSANPRPLKSPTKTLQQLAFSSESPKQAEKRQTELEQAGDDPDTGTKCKAFGFSLLDDTHCSIGLAPYDLSPDLKGELLNRMVDVLAYPDASMPEVSGDSASAIAEGLTAVVATLKGTSAGVLTPKLSTMALKRRTALSRVNSYEDLTILNDRLYRARNNILKAIRAQFQAVFLLQGYDEVRSARRATFCLPYRVLRDTYAGYIHLVQHLLHRHSQYESWESVQAEVDIRVEDLNLIRITAPGPVSIMMQVYAYMRDGVEGGWKSDELVRTSLVELTKRLDTVGDGIKSRVGEMEWCNHCHAFHYYNKRKFKCPYRAMSPEDAMAASRKLLGIDSGESPKRKKGSAEKETDSH